MKNLGSFLFVIAFVGGCDPVLEWPQQPDADHQPDLSASQLSAFQFVESHGAIFAWSKDERFLLFQGATDAESQKAALNDLLKHYQACQSPPCSETLPSATIQQINKTFAEETERLGQLGDYKVWESGLSNSYLIRCTAEIELSYMVNFLINFVPCTPDPDKDCIPPVNPPWSRYFELLLIL